MTGLRTLVTGGGGFVGANLVRGLLNRGATVHLLVRADTNPWRLSDIRSRVQVHTVDLRDAAVVRHVVRRVDPEVVFHLAKHRGDRATLDYRAAYDANVGATLNLLEAAAGLTALRRFVHGGSSLEYDLRRSPLTEDTALAPVTVHGVTKAAASLLCQQYAAQHHVPAVVLRFFTVYGPWEGPSRFIPSLMKGVLARDSVRLTRPGLTHDWIYVGDVVDACIRIVSADGVDGEVLNVATGVSSTNEDIVRLVEEAAGSRVSREPHAFPARAWDTDHWVADVSKTERVLGWRAATDVRVGLARTFEWFREHLDLYRAEERHGDRAS